jgi:hypothetical protein
VIQFKKNESGEFMKMKVLYFVVVLLVSSIAIVGCVSSKSKTVMKQPETESSLEDLVADENMNDSNSTTENINDSEEMDTTSSNSTSEFDTKSTESGEMDTETDFIDEESESNTLETNSSESSKEVDTEPQEHVSETQTNSSVTESTENNKDTNNKTDFSEDPNKKVTIDTSNGGFTIIIEYQNSEQEKQTEHIHTYIRKEEKIENSYTTTEIIEEGYKCYSCDKVCDDCYITCPHCNEVDSVDWYEIYGEVVNSAKYEIFDYCTGCECKTNRTYEYR